MSQAYYTRQQMLLSEDRLRQLRIAVAGVGAVGRQVVTQLFSAGARRITFYDHDTVEESNIGPQGWSPRHIGRLKTEALKDDLTYQTNEEEVSGLEAIGSRFPVGVPEPPEVLFSCVDRIDAREALFRAYQHQVGLFVDSRVAGETVHVLAAGDMDTKNYYETSLFRREDAFRAACTARMSIHVANIAAGLLIQQLSKWLRDIPVDKHSRFNLLAMELF